MDELITVGPESMRQFDAFPKLPSTYRQRTRGGGFITIFVAIVSFLLIVNDLAEYIWGWPDYEFSVDRNGESFMNINVDLVVNTPCRFLSVDLRDALGDRIHLSDGFKRDGVHFDVGQATRLKQWGEYKMLSAQQAVAQSRQSRGFFSFWRAPKAEFRPTYVYQPDASACRVYGSLEVKKVTANLHITTLGHGYASREHTDHSVMNMSHVITEFSFGPYFPDIAQPLDYSFEATNEHFMAYQYFLTVVPTTFIAPRSTLLDTHQYSVTHYERVLEHNNGAPGIFFKFDLEPISLIIHQRTTTFIQLMIRIVGVVGGVWVCTGWTIKVGSKVVDVVSGTDKTAGIVAAEATGVKRRWGGGDLRARPNAGGSPYTSYAGTPMSATFSHAGTPVANHFPSAPNSAFQQTGFPPTPPAMGYQAPHPSSPFPPSPLPGSNGFPSGPDAGVPPAPGHGFPASPMRQEFARQPPTPGSPAFFAAQAQARAMAALKSVSSGDGAKKVD